ncbi:MmpS family transport accessory protein [Corynebacterium sp. MSK006]|uniref:MmpS family transport accessory protein n=1 Tax=Corynebacterium sp. MSK006 TaxID=3050187 RepID=UPI00254F9A72|nr:MULTISPECIES: MmpS family transport accessory protein [Corynebacterium]MDK8894594.1 MmpS family transport accessory protein [Corynebacterium sp. MSK006]
MVIVVGLFAILVGCTALFGAGVSEADKQLNAERTVTYQIDGDAQDALATYNTGESDTVQENGLQAGWSKEATVTGLLGASLTATNGMYDEGQITCRILVDGETIAENTGSGAGASASCSADSSELADAAK